VTCYAHGARIILGDLDAAVTNKVKNDIVGKDNKEDRIFVVPLDVHDEASIKQAINLTVDKWKKLTSFSIRKVSL
jgi:enoyl-[acyl-carrier-protein] reductase (NADH)